MSHRHLCAYLHLQQLDLIGRRRHDLLVDHFGSIDTALNAGADKLGKVPGLPKKVIETMVATPFDAEACCKDIEQLERRGFQLTSLLDNDYPENLHSSSDGPVLLQYQGKLCPSDNAAIAIVGSRDCSDYGRKTARDFGYQLAERGFTVISGMARGIDSAAHRGALEAGGRTLAVQACGIDRIYPPSGRHLREDICRQGAVLTEHNINTPPLRHHFPRRNRIISALSLGVIIIEARLKSGSLITARWATEQNREVFALPGRIDQPRSNGCHRLIQDGAKLITSVDDVLEEFPAFNRRETKDPPLVLSANQHRVISAICDGNESFNDILRQGEFDNGELNLILFQLEALGCLQAQAGQRWLVADAGIKALGQKKPAAEATG